MACVAAVLVALSASGACCHSLVMSTQENRLCGVCLHVCVYVCVFDVWLVCQCGCLCGCSSGKATASWAAQSCR